MFVNVLLNASAKKKRKNIERNPTKYKENEYNHIEIGTAQHTNSSYIYCLCVWGNDYAKPHRFQERKNFID